MGAVTIPELRLAIVGPDLPRDNLDRRRITVCWCGRPWPAYVRGADGEVAFLLSCPTCRYRELPAWDGLEVGDEFVGPWGCEGRRHAARAR